MLKNSFCGLGRRELCTASLRRCFLLKAMMQDDSTPRLVKLTPSNCCVYCKNWYSVETNRNFQFCGSNRIGVDCGESPGIKKMMSTSNKWRDL